jgi:hypothetical protein
VATRARVVAWGLGARLRGIFGVTAAYDVPMQRCLPVPRIALGLSCLVGLVGVVGLGSLVGACGGGMPSVPAAGPDRASGQSSLMDKTLAGQKCSPKTHDRPFIIEWDATDLSQFEAITGNDIVFVRYDGCDLKVIDSCRNDSVKGALGSYKSIDWTSGSVEKMDISNEGELYAKLPLGAATLGGRVSAGEQFHMEYFVSGVRTSTRPVVYQADLESVPGCRGVTHYVYAYNLGAFALGSKKNIQGSADATVWGFGAGGSSKQGSAAEKRAGVLESCRAESAKELTTCKAPIRVTLREVEAGSNPDAKAAVAPETADALNLAGKIDAKMARSERAQGHADAARTKFAARDGKGCLAELDQADKLDPRPNVSSTNAGSYWSNVRASCLMVAGQCPAGRQMMRRYMETSSGGAMGPEQLDTYVDAVASTLCQGKLSPRDELLRANDALRVGTVTKKDAVYCNQAFERVTKAAAAVTSSGPDDQVVNSAKDGDHAFSTAQCLARAGDCASAWTLYTRSKFGAGGSTATFKNVVPHCKAYAPPTTGPSADPSAVRARSAAAMTSASTKMFKKDGTCLADLDTFDQGQTDPSHRSTSPTSSVAQTRAICLMLSKRCDEGERLQRASLTHRKVAANIVEMNVKSLRQEWCK